MIQFLQWDSEFFKKKIYSVSIDRNAKPSQLIQLYKELKDSGAQGVYFILKQLNKPFQDALKEQGIPLMDEKVVYEKQLSSLNVLSKSALSIKPYFGPVTGALIDLSIEAGKYSRFRADPELSNKFEELYTLWMQRSITRIIADSVLVFAEDEVEKGVVTFKIKDGIGTIGLIGVTPHMQGRKIGSQLIFAVENYYLANNIFISQVATQAQNHMACRFYSKLGYNITTVEPIYHLWI